MLDKVHDIGKANKGLLDNKLILLKLLLSCLRILRWVFMIKCQLIDRFTDDLLQGREETLV